MSTLSQEARRTHRRLAVLLAALAGTAAAPLAAEDDWYVRLGGGVAYQADADGARLTDQDGRQSVDASFD